MSISDKAFVHADAQLGEGVTVEPFATVSADTVIGDGTWIGPNCTIMEGARIGNNCKIFPGAVVSGIPQDLKFEGEHSTAEIGNNTTIRECVTVNRGTKDREKTSVGSNCLLMAYSHVAHDTFIGDNCVVANSVNLAGHVTIGDWVILEGLVAVQQFISIGSHSFIAGATLVRKNVPPFVKAAREPISYIGVNVVGLRRRGFNDDTIAHIEDIYREIFVRNSNVNAGLEAISNLVDSKEKDSIIAFIQNSPRGIMRGLAD